MCDRPGMYAYNDENEYRVARHAPRPPAARPPAARPPTRFPPCAACCWVEVYDSDPSWANTTAVRLAAGYISEAKDTLEQLCALLPLEEWADVFCTKPGCDRGGIYFAGKDLSRGALNQSLDTSAAHPCIYHNDHMPLGKLQLVIVRRSQI